MTEEETERLNTYTKKEAFIDGLKIHSKKAAVYKTGEDVENNRKKLHSLILNIKFPLLT
jgi:phage-related protein